MGRESSVENAEIMMMGKPTNVVHVVQGSSKCINRDNCHRRLRRSAMKKDNVLNSGGSSFSLSLFTDGVLIRRCHVIMAVSAYNNKDTGDDTQSTGRGYHFPLTYY